MDDRERVGVERPEVDAFDRCPERGDRRSHVHGAQVKASICAGIGAGYLVVLAMMIVR
jgi:hypothetical protein